MINKKYLISAVFSFAVFFVTAQVRFSANPVAICRNADALLSATVTSSYQNAVTGQIIIKVTAEATLLPVVTITLTNVKLLPGSSTISRFREQANRIFYDNELSNIIQNTGSFAPAAYSICFQFTPDDKLINITDNEHCIFTIVTPRIPLTLIQPVDSICDFKPVFTWLGRKATSASSAFKVICVAVATNQTPEEALQNNVPVINQLLYQQTNQMNFPGGIPALKEGKQYAWQVFEVAGKNVLNSSEIFSFVPGCKLNVETSVESFAEIKTFYTGRKYYFSSSINFSFNNPYAEKKLLYSIVHVATQKKLTNLPEITMSKGLNLIKLNTEDIKGLQKNEQYKIEVYNLATTTHYINFIIKE
jgi:YHS domain-containing protein